MMRFNWLYFIGALLVSALLLLVSCEKVVEVQLKNSNAKYVIEGVMTNETGRCRVKITTTNDFKASNEFAGVAGAVIKIESKGVIYNLKDMGNGIYQHSTVKGVPGQTYQLTVSLNDQTFTASSTMPLGLPFQDMFIARNDFSTTKAVVNVRYADIPAAKNYYWFQQYVNGIEQSAFGLVTDEFSDGQEIIASLLFENTTGDSSKDFKKGDRLTVEMHNIEAPIYTYLLSLYGASGTDNGTPFANPQSNLSGGALGYFSAHTTQRKVVVIP